LQKAAGANRTNWFGQKQKGSRATMMGEYRIIRRFRPRCLKTASFCQRKVSFSENISVEDIDDERIVSLYT
jgi:hypothetical protein